MTGVRFLADSMLGKLARWLRLMGYYVEYVKSDATDSEIIDKCLRENLFLFSRDRQLCIRYPRSLYLESDSYMDQLKEIVSRFPPDRANYFSRCPICNGRVEKILTDQYLNQLPESVKERFEYIYLCDDCGKVYWEGSHFDAILETIKKIENVK